MVALFLDLDGTTLRKDSNEWLPGVLEALVNWHQQGHQIIFVTMRGPHNPYLGLSKEVTEVFVKTLPFPVTLLTDIQSPRVLVDDNPPFAVHAAHNDSGWLKELIP